MNTKSTTPITYIETPTHQVIGLKVGKRLLSPAILQTSAGIRAVQHHLVLPGTSQNTLEPGHEHYNEALDRFQSEYAALSR